MNSLEGNVISLKVRGGDFVMQGSRILVTPHLRRGHDPVDLTLREVKLVNPLVERQGITIPHRQLAEACIVAKNHLRMLMGNINRKIGESRTTPNRTFESIRHFGSRCTLPQRSPEEILEMMRDSEPPDHLLHRVVQGGDFVMDTSSGEVLVAPHVASGGVVQLSPTEAVVVGHLLRHQGNAISRDEMAEILTPGKGEFIKDSNIKGVVFCIRQKIGEMDTTKPSFQTVPGVGYKAS